MTSRTDDVRHERDTLLMLILDGDEFGDGAFERAQAKLNALWAAMGACYAVIDWERSSLEQGKLRDAQLLVCALVKCHQAVNAEKEVKQ